jgi:glycosyltransferase involved in cell wall biosynthesis
MGISLCMIVKNEQDWVPSAVESVRSIVDEVIILDTGGTDSTINGLRPFNPEVVQFEWNESFAAARNASFLLAHQPWILVLDADERIAAKDLALVAEASGSRATHGHQLIQRNYVRLMPDAHFERTV